MPAAQGARCAHPWAPVGLSRQHTQHGSRSELEGWAGFRCCLESPGAAPAPKCRRPEGKSKSKTGSGMWHGSKTAVLTGKPFPKRAFLYREQACTVPGLSVLPSNLSHHVSAMRHCQLHFFQPFFSHTKRWHCLCQPSRNWWFSWNTSHRACAIMENNAPVISLEWESVGTG